MSTTESKKSKRRRNKRGSNKTTGNEPWSLGLVDQVKDRISESEGISEIEQLMDTEDDPPRSHFANPYLVKERCLLCRCQRPDTPQNNKKGSDNEDDLMANQENDITSLAQLRFWVCPDCKHSAEEDEKRQNSLDTNYLAPELLLQAPNLENIPPSSESNIANGSLCNCEACIERREIEAEHEHITQQLQSHWMEVRQAVRSIYREACSNSLENSEISSKPDIARLQDLVHKLCSRDPHQLYQRLESQGREYVIEVRVRLQNHLTTLGQKTVHRQYKQFVALLLDEYASLCAASRELTNFLQELESEHLKRFNLTWELVNRHLFQSIVYSDNIIQDNLRQSPSSRDSSPPDGAANLLHRYTKFTDEMTVISVMWKESQQLLEEYNETQAAMKAKQRMLKEDLEFFKAQRKLLEQQVRRKTGNVPHSDYGPNFTETMRHLLAGTKPSPEDCHCSHCNQKRCPCDECGISHMITCGIIGTENEEMSLPNLSFSGDQSRYLIDVSPSSMSSSDSSGPCSPPFSHKMCPTFDQCGEEADLFFRSDDSEDDQQGDTRSLDSCSKCDDDSAANLKSMADYQEDSMTADILEENLIPPPSSGMGEMIESCECHVCTSPAQTKGQQAKSEEKPCECYVCLQHNDGSLHTSFLPQALPPPGSLYPHGPNHVKPLIHPHLYNLHTSASSKSHKHTSDLDGMDLYTHPCGEWENTYDNTKMLLSSRKYGGHIGNDLFTGNSQPLMNGNDDPSLRVHDGSSSKMSSDSLHSPNKIVSNSTNGHIHSDTCFNNLKANGKNSTSGQSPHHHGDYCVKHTPSLHSHNTNPATSPSHNKLPMKITPEILRTATINAAKEEAARALSSAHPFHICNHTHQHMHGAAPTPKHTCQNMLDPKTGLFTVPMTTANTRVPGTGCTDPECDGHHFENEDSLDDTGSEKSSSTTNSTQRDSKHCDCCYCEVFGHGAPSVAPVSRNYPEMRERLRLRLTKKKQTECKNAELKSSKEKQERAVDYRGLDELISFINGTTNEKTVSSKAAKRARQKQRKAEERARRVEEAQLKQEEAAAAREAAARQAQEQAVREANQNGSSNTPTSQRKNKKNKKEANENINNNSMTCRSNNSSYSSESGLSGSPNRERKTPKLSGNNVSKTNSNNTVNCYNNKNKKLTNEDQEYNYSPNFVHKASLTDHTLVDKQPQSSGKKKKKDNKGPTSSPVSQQQVATYSGCVSRQEFCVQKPLSSFENKQHSENQENHQDNTRSGNCGNKSFVNCSKNQENSDILQIQNNSLTAKGRKNKKKKNAMEENGSIDDVFQPKDIDLDNGELDETERELEAFKRFCWNSIPPERKEKVHVNLKDIIIKKKSAISCT